MSYSVQNKPVNPLVLTDNVIKELFKPYLLKLDRISSYREMLDNEMYLRRIKSEDAVLFLMIQQLMNDVNTIAAENPYPLTLKALKPVADKSKTNPLNEIHLFRNEIKYFNATSSGKILRDQQLGSWIIYSDDTKIKKLGNLKQLLRDRRINELSKYILQTDTTPQINYRRLVSEFHIYDHLRIEVLKPFFDLEVKLKENGSYQLNQNGYKNFRKIMDTFTACPESLREELICIRNAFLHNQYPSPGKINGIINFNPANVAIPEKEGFTIVKQIAVIAQTRINEALELIKQL